MSDFPTSSLIISTYNWPKALELVLLSLKRQTVMPGEVIIADDGSGTETRQLIQKFQKDFPVPLHHVWHEDKGFRKTVIMNKAIAKATGDYIICIDGDIITEKHFAEDHLALAEPNVFVYGKRVKLKESILKRLFRTKKVKFNFFSRGISKRGRMLRMLYKAEKYPANDFRFGAVRGCNMAFWRKDFIQINGYNEEMTGWGREDTEMTHRLFNIGVLGRNVKYRAVAFHIYHSDQPRDREVVNTAIEKRTIEDKLTRCKVGVDQYL